MLDPVLLDALRSRFELQAMSIAQLPETLEQELIKSCSLIVESLVQGNKALILGFEDGMQIASVMVEELANNSGIDRPALPGLLISHQNTDIQTRQIQSLGARDDCLIIIEASGKDHSEAIYRLSELALSIGLKVIIISPNVQESLRENPDNTELSLIHLNSVSRMDYLCSLAAVTMTMVALIDHHLFQQPI